MNHWKPRFDLKRAERGWGGIHSAPVASPTRATFFFFKTHAVRCCGFNAFPFLLACPRSTGRLWCPERRAAREKASGAHRQREGSNRNPERTSTSTRISVSLRLASRNPAALPDVVCACVYVHYTISSAPAFARGTLTWEIYHALLLYSPPLFLWKVSSRGWLGRASSRHWGVTIRRLKNGKEVFTKDSRANWWILWFLSMESVRKWKKRNQIIQSKHYI